MKEIAVENIIKEEALPLPYVYYPKLYGTFLGFSEDVDSDIYFCSCFKESISNYIRQSLINISSIGSYDDGTRKFFLDLGKFPDQIISEIKTLPESKEIIKSFRFKDRICHECNNKTPSLRYCHEMYGSVFKQNYGWYIFKQAYEWGIIGHEINYELCPDEIIDLLDLEPKKYLKLFHSHLRNGEGLKAIKLQSNYRKQERKIWNVIENEVRQKFGHKKIGDAWTSETILYYIVEGLFPNRKIFRHFRPAFLEGLELDIYIEDFRIGVEYQGIQHYKPVKHWGGEEALKKLQERDRKKIELCKDNNIKLIHFEHYEELSEEFVASRIKEYINNN